MDENAPIYLSLKTVAGRLGLTLDEARALIRTGRLEIAAYVKTASHQLIPLFRPPAK